MDERLRKLEAAYRESGLERDGERWINAEARASGVSLLSLVRHVIRLDKAIRVIVDNTIPVGPHLEEVLDAEVTIDELVTYARSGTCGTASQGESNENG